MEVGLLETRESDRGEIPGGGTSPWSLQGVTVNGKGHCPGLLVPRDLWQQPWCGLWQTWRLSYTQPSLLPPFPTEAWFDLGSDLVLGRACLVPSPEMSHDESKPIMSTPSPL